MPGANLIGRPRRSANPSTQECALVARTHLRMSSKKCRVFIDFSDRVVGTSLVGPPVPAAPSHPHKEKNTTRYGHSLRRDAWSAHFRNDRDSRANDLP